MNMLLKHWAKVMKGKSLRKRDLPPFPIDENYLKDLWKTECEVRLTKESIESTLTKMDGRKAPGYDGLTYFAY